MACEGSSYVRTAQRSLGVYDLIAAAEWRELTSRYSALEQSDRTYDRSTQASATLHPSQITEPYVSDATLFRLNPIVGVSQKRPTISLSKQKRLRSFHIPEPLVFVTLKLLRPWRWRSFWLPLVSAFRLAMSLAVIG